ncbi:MAG TPA: protein kinase [Polyangiaceae bacterium]|nr:protein kinase [Polyangiaceae bacterium]
MDAGLETADLPSGYRFGNYVILERIGRGGMARVYRAEHSALRKRVALKLMDHALHDQGAAHRQFLREGRAAAAVKHPNIVDITDVGVWQGIPYLVMELLEGWDLETQLHQRGPMSDGEIARLALPILSGLAVAHDAGVVHRDLKPSNIFLAKGADGEQVPKVLDFGISKLARDAADLTATPYGTLLGTPMYLPPEALRGAQLTPASDQYSLGVVLYECAVGAPPFQYDSLVNLLQRIASGSFEPPSRSRPDISAVIERAIVRAMHPDPDQRFPHVRDLGRALWEVASPRTQVLWGRAFGPVEGRATPAVAPRRSPLAPPNPADPALTNTRHAYSGPPPARARNQLSWLAAGAVLALGALATTVLPRGFAPRVEQLSRPLEPSAGEPAARAAAIASEPVLPTSSPVPPSEAQGPPSAPPRGEPVAVRPVQELPGAAPALSAPRTPASKAESARERRAQPRARAAANGASLRGPAPEAAQRAAPELRRRQPARARAADAVGANGSPLLD